MKTKIYANIYMKFVLLDNISFRFVNGFFQFLLSALKWIEKETGPMQSNTFRLKIWTWLIKKMFVDIYSHLERCGIRDDSVSICCEMETERIYSVKELVLPWKDIVSHMLDRTVFFVSYFAHKWHRECEFFWRF